MHQLRCKYLDCIALGGILRSRLIWFVREILSEEFESKSYHCVPDLLCPRLSSLMKHFKLGPSIEPLHDNI